MKTRREFIKDTAASIAVVALEGSTRAFAAAKSRPDANAIRQFKNAFGGRVIVPTDAEYDFARKAGGTDKHPAIVAQCGNEQDVLRCIDFARQYELEVAVRSGNHSFLGWGTCNEGIVVDLSRMKGIVVDPVKRTVVVSTGSTAEQILAATSAHGLAPVLGQCGGVGAGLVLGGGLGWLSGRHGATCDNLVSAHIVTAEGRSLTADSVTNPDLFWAIRGGGGNFGIATSLEYQLYPLKEVLAGSLVYPINRAASILRLFRELMSTAPDDLQADCYLTTRNAAAKLNVVYSGRLDKGEQLLNTFRSANTPDQDSMKRTSFSELYQMFGADEPASCPLALDKGTYVEKLSDEVIDLVVDRLRQSPPSCETVFNFSHYMHGQVCRVSPDATAFELRNADAVHLVFWVQWKDAVNTSACTSWHNDTFDRLQRYSGGRIYSNFMSTEEGGPKAIYASNYSRLLQVKRKYDPQNFFHLNQNIQPK